MSARRVAAAISLAVLLQMGAAQPAAAADAPAAPSMPGVDLSSSDATVHLQYATILFYKGRRMLQEGAGASGESIFREVEAELRRAIALADQDSDATRRTLIQSQSAFMLGDIAYFVRQDKKSAVKHYQMALQYFPQHDGAVQAMGRLLMSEAVQ